MKNAIDQQRAQVAIRHRRLDPAGHQALGVLDPTHRNLREGKNRPENREHRRQENRPTDHRMEQPPVKPVRGGELVRVRPACGEFAEIADVIAAGAFAIVRASSPFRLRRGGEGETQRLFQLDDALAGVGLHRHHGDAQFFG
jgi:hypothetical protein